MIKLYRARSLLYRRQILQVNIRWKALDEIYKIYMLLHRSDLNISEKNRQTFSHFSANFIKISYFRIIFIEYCSDFHESSSEFRRILNRYSRKCGTLNIRYIPDFFLTRCLEENEEKHEEKENPERKKNMTERPLWHP